MICLSELTIVIPRLPCLFTMAKAVSSTVELVNSVTSESVKSLTLQCELLPVSVSPLSWTHDLMDGEELDDT
jgi:hypothetical protein